MGRQILNDAQVGLEEKAYSLTKYPSGDNTSKLKYHVCNNAKSRKTEEPQQQKKTVSLNFPQAKHLSCVLCP